MQSKDSSGLFGEIWQYFRDFLLPKDYDVEIMSVQPVQENQSSLPISNQIAGSSTQTIEKPIASTNADISLDITAPPNVCETDIQPQDEIEFIPPIPLDTRGHSCLFDIRKFASWSGPDGERGLDAAMKLFASQYPGHTIEAEQALTQGQLERDLYNKAYQLGFGKQSEEILKKLLDTNDLTNDIRVNKRMQSQYKKGISSRQRKDEERSLRKKGTALSNVQARTASITPTDLPKATISSRPHANPSNPDNLKANSNAKPRATRPVPTALPKAPLTSRPLTNHPIPDSLHANDMRCLKPKNHWQFIIDESGSTFDDTAIEATQKKLGRFVGILVPFDQTVLTTLPHSWHAVDKNISEIDSVLQSILDAPVGVLGIDVRSVPFTPGERWMDGVALLIDWVLRLLPMDGETHIEVMIENRGLFKAGQSWEVVRRDCMRRLAFAYPERALHIDLDINVIEKKGTHLNGYADAVAFTWAKTTDSSKERLKRAGLEGTCLLSSGAGIDARSMLNAWDAFAQGVHLPPSLWWDMLETTDVLNPAALISTLLNLVGRELRTKPKLWGSLLAEVKGRMAIGPVDLQRLATGIDWLQRYKPKDCVILPSMRLIWLTVQLALANHMGKIEEKWQSELELIEKQIFDEAAPLVCYAHLHRAVAATNRYDFGLAGRILGDWKHLPPSVPGLKHWAQVQSSLGQHAAFLGDNSRAIEFFRKALSAFFKLSDPEARISNELQTGCYLAIAMMDHSGSDNNAVRMAVESVTGPLPEAAARLAISSNPADRYAHHLLMRWLAYRCDEEVLTEYLKIRNSWHVGNGHPWPLIQLYRGILMYHSHPDEAKEFVLDAAERAFADDQGPVVRLIGSCCRVVAIGMGEPWPDSEAELNKLFNALPLAAERITRLKSAIKDRIEPTELLPSVLQFNFR